MRLVDTISAGFLVGFANPTLMMKLNCPDAGKAEGVATTSARFLFRDRRLSTALGLVSARLIGC